MCIQNSGKAEELPKFKSEEIENIIKTNRTAEHQNITFDDEEQTITFLYYCHFVVTIVRPFSLLMDFSCNRNRKSIDLIHRIEGMFNITSLLNMIVEGE